MTQLNGQPVIQLAVQREQGSNVIAIKRAMSGEVAAINRDILEPAGLDLALVSDDVRYVEASVFNVWKNLALGALAGARQQVARDHPAGTCSAPR